MGVLTVKVDGARTELGQRRRRGQPAVDVCPRPAVGGDHAGDDVLVVADDEAALDSCLGSRPT